MTYMFKKMFSRMLLYVELSVKKCSDKLFFQPGITFQPAE
jgi:hypothetical protein